MPYRWMAAALIAVALLAGCGAQATASASPWLVKMTGTPGTTWQGGCSTDTMNGSNNPTYNVTLPWSRRFSANAIDVNCYFQDQQPWGSARVVIYYDGQPLARGSSGPGGYGIASAYATQP